MITSLIFSWLSTVTLISNVISIVGVYVGIVGQYRYGQVMREDSADQQLSGLPEDADHSRARRAGTAAGIRR